MPPRPALPPIIAHVDMNTYFVSVERLKDPALDGKPVVVGGDPQSRSVVSSASYEARRYGIHSAMPMSQALRRCPDLVIVPPHFHDYQHYHDLVKAILQDFTPVLEMTSIDEGYLDLTGTDKLWGPPLEIGRRIRRRILDEIRLPASVGISSNKLVSKVASDLAKPVPDPRLGKGSARGHPHPSVTGEGSALSIDEGVLVVPAGQEAEFLAPLSVGHLPGCGQVTVARLQGMGIETVRDLASQPREELVALFGEAGRMLWQRAHGQGSSTLQTERQRKSISKEITFQKDVQDLAHLRAILHQQSEEVGATLRRRREQARTVTLKLRYAGFETHTAARTLPRPTDLTMTIFDTAARLLKDHLSEQRPVRLIGVGVSGLMKGWGQEDLFAPPEQGKTARRETAVDRLRERFGPGSVLTGESIRLMKDSSDDDPTDTST